MTQKITDVAVAIFIKPDGTFLLSSRPAGKPYPGYWEFPGGKIEPNESTEAALVRELIEELNVTITHCTPWFTFMMHYTHATVRLHCWRVHAWEGEMHGMEGQQFAWQRLDALAVAPTLPGCVPIFRALALPPIYAISNAAEAGVDNYLRMLDKALEAGLRMLLVREPTMAETELAAFARAAAARVRAHGARLVVHRDFALATELNADGIHLAAHDLTGMQARPGFAWVAASAHDRADIERAAALGCDFAMLGAVKATRSHPDRAPLGWNAFAAMTTNAPIPVYALGGMTPGDMAEAVAHGAHGLAMQRSMI